MADANTPAEPMTDKDDDAPPASTEFEPALPLKDTGVAFEPASDEVGQKPDTPTEAPAAGIRQQLTTGAAGLQSQAGEGLRGLADMGKQRASGALDQLAQMLTDAAEQVDAKLGAQYGGYARTGRRLLEAGAGAGFGRAARSEPRAGAQEPGGGDRRGGSGRLRAGAASPVGRRCRPRLT